VCNGYQTIALTDHVGIGYLDRLVTELAGDCELARASWPVLAVPGVELTHVPPAAIAEAARRAKELGACVVVVHGETIVEPVEKGTNKAALECPDVDILAHPGLITIEDAELAAASGTFLEISARRGHSLTNGHVVRLARLTGARLILNSDAHQENDILTSTLVRQVAMGAGLDEAECEEMLTANIKSMLKKLPVQDTA